MKLRLEYRNLQELSDNPKNWRKHPDEQTKPLKEVIDKVGFAGAVLFNETTQHLIDGHARKGLGYTEFPVLCGQWTQEEEDLILATLDPLSYLAESNNDALKDLLDNMEPQDEVINNLLKNLSFDNGISAEFNSVNENKVPRLDEKKKITCPNCGNEF